MIAIKVEIWPFGDKTKARTIGRMYIVNDGTADSGKGNYRVKITQGDEPELSGGYEFNTLPTPLEGRILDHERRLGFWPIVYRAISFILPDTVHRDK